MAVKYANRRRQACIISLTFGYPTISLPAIFRICTAYSVRVPHSCTSSITDVFRLYTMILVTSARPATNPRKLVDWPVVNRGRNSVGATDFPKPGAITAITRAEMYGVCTCTYYDRSNPWPPPPARLQDERYTYSVLCINSTWNCRCVFSLSYTRSSKSRSTTEYYYPILDSWFSFDFLVMFGVVNYIPRYLLLITPGL